MVRERVSRRQRLIEVGMDLFCKHTYEEISIDDIAEVANISKGLLYYYFPTKHDFYVAVVQSAAEQLLQAIEDASTEQLGSLERLRAGLNAYFAYAESHAQAYVTLMRGGVGADAQIAAIIDATRQTQVQRVLEGAAREKPLTPLHHIAISGWIGFVEAACIAWLEQRNVEREQLSDLATTAFITLWGSIPR